MITQGTPPADLNAPKPNPVLGAGGLHHAGVVSKDWENSLEFYTKGLGFTLTMSFGKIPQRCAFLDSGNGHFIELIESAHFTPGDAHDEVSAKTVSPNPHFNLATDRFEAAWDNALAHGATVLFAPKYFEAHTHQGFTWKALYGYLQGPNGEWIELVEGLPV